MAQYFDNNVETKENRKNIKIKFKDKVYNFVTDSAVFSKDKLDYGTKLLLETITKNKIEGNVLDLGCGYGPVGIILKDIYENIDVDMVDITDRAVTLSKNNAKSNNINANIYISNIYENVSHKFDYIITNPPIRAGKEIIRKFLFEANDHLNEEGQLWFVMRKDHGVKTMIKELETIYKVNVEDKDKGFYIVKCKKSNN